MREVLGRLPLFSRLDPDQLDQVASACRLVHLGRGEVLFHAGEPATAFFAVVSGQVKLALSSGDGPEKILELIRPGETFGEAVVFTGQPYPVTATGLASSQVLRIADVVTDLVDRDPTFARRMLAGMAVRLHTMVRDVAAVTLWSGRQRVVGFLLGLAGEDPGPGTIVQLPATKAVLASRLSLTPETFSRTLRELSDTGLIEVHGAQIVLLDPSALTPAAGPGPTVH
ncbi:MAG: Crp/Fnr family transcriptional regulator [Micrococcales bacterium]|nr:Crp/Fnr family transcriptional regulator [Micrococcales bacterium]MCL2668049.1 Crp/Fnr family transcriptional regulator [Micrococcales bacterium]